MPPGRAAAPSDPDVKGGARRGPLDGPRRRPPLRFVRVRVGARGGYRVCLGAGALRRLVQDLASGRLATGWIPAHTVVVADATVARLYGRALVTSLAGQGLRATLLDFPAGEIHKTRESKARLEDRLARLAFGRDGVIVALGGGVTGDLAGFLAATWHRGVPVVQAPTTLMGMLDSSIGGKVAVDHPLGKNLIGAFHPPLGVYADTRTLVTLPDRELRAGLAEALKCGAIASAALFRSMARDREEILRRHPDAIHRLLLAAALVKARMVSGDERESGRRMLLNFGHTLGHAVEAAAGYRLRHGEAVAIGMVFALRLSRIRGTLKNRNLPDRLARLLRRYHLPVSLRQDPRPLFEALAKDKKKSGGAIDFVLVRDVGRPCRQRIPLSILKEECLDLCQSP